MCTKEKAVNGVDIEGYHVGIFLSIFYISNRSVNLCLMCVMWQFKRNRSKMFMMPMKRINPSPPRMRSATARIIILLVISRSSVTSDGCWFGNCVQGIHVVKRTTIEYEIY